MAHLTALLALAGLLLGAAPSASAPASPPAPAAAPAPPAAAPLLVAPAATRAPPDVASFTRHSRFVDVQLSPKGTWLAMISMEGGKQTLSFVKLADRSGASRLTPSADSMVGSIMWVNDERLVASLALADGTLASPSFTGELLAVDPVGAANKRIFGYRAGASAADTRTKKRGPDLAAGFLIGKAPGDDRSVLVATRDLTESGDRKMRVIKLDVYGGNQGDVMLAPTLNAEFVTDERHEIRGAESIDSKGRREAFERVPGGWKPLTARAGVTALSELQGWRSGAGRLLVTEKEGDGWGLYEVALEGGARTRIGQTRLAPPSRVLRDKATGQVLAVESQPDLPDWQILVPEHPLAQVLSGLLDAYPGQNVVIYSTTEDQRLAVAFVYSDRNPGQFLLVDVAARKAEPLLETRPWVKAEASAEVAAFHIKASDGQLIHGYVTYPPDLAPGARAPVVVMPHGGPHGPRDVWGYFPDAQLLASRGYAVLQVNFRGSGGYGLDYERAGYQRWGDRIMDDILDATRWLVGKGKVDAGRMCTYGGSFGGYSALQLVARAPETVPLRRRLRRRLRPAAPRGAGRVGHQRLHPRPHADLPRQRRGAAQGLLAGLPRRPDQGAGLPDPREEGHPGRVPPRRAHAEGAHRRRAPAGVAGGAAGGPRLLRRGGAAADVHRAAGLPRQAHRAGAAAPAPASGAPAAPGK